MLLKKMVVKRDEVSSWGVVLRDVEGAIPYRVGELSGCRGFSVVCSLIELNNIVDDI